jgi:hypothetical protein
MVSDPTKSAKSGPLGVSPEVTSAVLDGRQQPGLSLARIPKLLLLPWTKQRVALG